MNLLVITRQLGLTDYETTLQAMQAFTQARTPDTPDELWLTEHDSVYTLGLNRKGMRLPQNNIPLLLVDRGGKITYHGIGQVVIYLLIDLKRRGLNIRQLVSMMENSIISLLSEFGIRAYAEKDAPGVYVESAKIASLGLRIKNQCSYHGLSLNVDMDLGPFSAIDPCGYQGLRVTQTKDLGVSQTPVQLGLSLLKLLKDQLHESNAHP